MDNKNRSVISMSASDSMIYMAICASRMVPRGYWVKDIDVSSGHSVLFTLASGKKDRIIAIDGDCTYPEEIIYRLRPILKQLNGGNNENDLQGKENAQDAQDA